MRVRMRPWNCEEEWEGDVCILRCLSIGQDDDDETRRKAKVIYTLGFFGDLMVGPGFEIR